MATYQELRTRSQQVRDEQNIGGNTALRVGQLLMDIVKYFYDTDMAASEYLEQHFAMVNDGTHLLNWQQSPIVILHTMGDDYDDGDFSALSQGENYYRAGFVMEANGQGGGINGETPKANVLYVNLSNDTLYTWNGSSFDAITSGGGGGSISGDDIIKNAYYSNGNLVLIIETEGGDKMVTIPVTFDASNYVPTSRTVNGKALSNNITLSQSDIPGLVAALAAKVGYSDDEWLQVKAGAIQAATSVPNTTTVNGKRLNDNITIQMADIPGLLQAIGEAGEVKSVSVNGGTAQTPDGNGNVNITVEAGGLTKEDISVETQGDGTVDFNVKDDTYTINLNHTHEGMAKLEKVTEATLPQTFADDTIYVQVDDAEDPQEIQSLYIAGLEFVGGGGGSADDGMPKVTSPKDESTLNLGENSGSGVSKSIVVRAKNLNYGGSTTGLTIEAIGTGLSLSYGQQTGQSSITIPQSNGVVNTEITVAYSGSGGLEDGELRFKQANSVLAVVVVVVVVAPPYFPEGFLADTAWERAGEQLDYPDSVQGYCTNPFTEAFHIALDSNNCYDVVVKGGFVKNNGELTRGKIMFKEKLTDALTNSAYTKSSEPIRLKAVNGSTLYNYVSATFKTSEIADCYIYDNVAHVYLWAGKNVDTSVAPEIPNV